MRKRKLGHLGYAALCCGSLCGCSLEAQLRLNELQFLGTHNSYHIEPEPALLAGIAAIDPQPASTLQYTELPLQEQLDRGVRQLELDVYSDPQGGHYSNRAGLIALGRDPRSGIAALDEPGLKVLHIQDLDFQSHCLTFRECLSQLDQWSRANPYHLPIMVMVEPKEEPIADPLHLGFAVPLPFDAAAVDGIDAEIRSVFEAARLITPDEVRGSNATLEQAVLAGNWPAVAQSRGRVLFTFLNRGRARALYAEGRPSLEGRVMFVDSDLGQPDAAFFSRDSALIDGAEIDALVRAGYLVRTRADIDTLEARSGDRTLQVAAFASGAQFVSTDYVVPDPRFGSYSATLPGGFVALCNPVTAPPGCDSEQLSALDGIRRAEGGGLIDAP
jgi:calcium-dependent phosphoinositide phospholipase C